MKSWWSRFVSIVVTLLIFTDGPLTGSASAAGKIALVLDVGGRGDLSFNIMEFRKL